MNIEEFADAIYGLYDMRTNAVAIRTFRDIKRTKKYCFSSEQELIESVCKNLGLDGETYDELKSLFGSVNNKRLLFRTINNLHRNATSKDTESIEARLSVLEDRVLFLEELIKGE